jgi:uncharacterized protein
MLMQESSPVFLLIIFLAAAALQGTKVILDVARTKTFRLSYLWSSGGFPSFHAGVSASVATLIYLEQGMTMLFIVTLVFSFLLRYDAINVRYEAGKHAHYLNTIRGQLLNVFSHGEEQVSLNERIGHTLPELLAGIVIGSAVTVMCYGMFSTAI